MFVIVENVPYVFRTMINGVMVEIVDRADVLGEKKIECPIKRDANFLVEPGQFAQVNRPPHPPGEEAGEIESENPGHARAPAD